MGNVLVMDTCGEGGYVAVVSLRGDGSAAVSERHLQPRATQEQLLPAVEGVLGEAGVPLHALAGIAVVRGPGSFTGVRIGLAAAKGLCEAASLPLIALSRLAVLAEAVETRPVWAWLQAGRGDVYAARFRAGGPDSENHFGNGFVWDVPQAIAAVGIDTVAVCEESLRSTAPHSVWVEPAAFEQALRVCAIDAAQKERWADVALSDALYLRVPDAELALRARQG